MARAKAKRRNKTSKPASTANRGARKPVDLEALRRQIGTLVGNRAMDLVEVTIGEVDKGHYLAMKYLFELIGLYPATEQEIVPGEDSLAKTLLRRLGVPEAELAMGPAITKDCTASAEAIAAGGDAVK